MATLKIALTLTSVDTSSDALSLSVTDSLTVASPSIGLSKVTATTTGGDTIIAPNVDSVKYTFIRHTGVNSSGAAVTATLAVEDTDNVQMAVLEPGEFMFFPHAKGSAKGVQLEAAAATIVAEYAYFTKG